MSANNKKGSPSSPASRKKEERPYTEFQIEHSVYTTQLNRKFEERKQWIPPDRSQLRSYIPGTIIKVLVKEGQEVREGDPLLVLEAMKMKNSIVAEYDGVIREVHVTVGEKVPKGKVMVEQDLT